jgi:hypothetical protein
MPGQSEKGAHILYKTWHLRCSRPGHCGISQEITLSFQDRENGAFSLFIETLAVKLCSLRASDFILTLFLMQLEHAAIS